MINLHEVALFLQLGCNTVLLSLDQTHCYSHTSGSQQLLGSLNKGLKINEFL